MAVLQERISGRSLGADIRALRKARGLTLQDMADALNRSVGWVSQVERDISAPSIGDLRDLAKIFDVSVSILFGQSGGPVAEAGRVVRSGARRKIGAADGLVEELLSPDLTDDFEMVHSVFQPGAEMTEAVTRPTQEVAYLVSGTLDLWIGDDAFIIEAGDSFRIRGESYRWANPYDQPAVAIWVIAPPVY
ncbi:helix-turn-helix domain-containing protein [Pseudaestuariivita atlantica]|uniref:XRE family transcriptional regulator n=1 Tax=Pseudaestuariivita atlantica TaxID=1317121 RepID=A0A0L1JNZ5_9RHOB|nr:XRE family transcriptional regulator [Pseudaestuariivita atlantica]KNG93485.1 XRE family transcriptional regulator [Pseudaestuariivita atlantica]